jgi:hypothetical protein
MIVDTYLVYRFIRKLTTPFEKWEAYKQGVIDKNGKIIKPKNQRKTSAERTSLTMFDRLVLNLKKLIMKVPGGSRKWATYAAAILMLREHEDLTEERLEYLLENLEQIHEDTMLLIEANQFFTTEDAPTMAAGHGAIAGIGIGSKGEPGFFNRGVKKRKKKNRIGRRILPK